MTSSRPPDPPRARAQRRIAAICAGVAFGMMGLSYAAVPLYSLFCQVTGYDGTPLVGKARQGAVVERSVEVRFDANVAPGLPWRFTPEAPSIRAKLGETKTVFFKVENTASTPTTGIAAFNVQPGVIGAYFVKVECFCFNEQTLKAGETMDFPVVFYIDPDMRNDMNVRDIADLTLSYTYFAVKNPKAEVATTSAAAAKANP
jgi:cytochrome c oxidase assembly protein subunit 11